MHSYTNTIKVSRVRLAVFGAFLTAQLVACGTSPTSIVGAETDDSKRVTSQNGGDSAGLTIQIAGRERSASALLDQPVYAYFERSSCNSPRTNPIVSEPSQNSSVRFTATTQQSFSILGVVPENSKISSSLAPEKRWYYKIQMRDGSHWFLLAAPLMRDLFSNDSEFIRASNCYGTTDIVAINPYAEANALEAQRVRQKRESERQAPGVPKLGMSPAQVERSQWGFPKNKSVTQSQLGVMEFWFYDGGSIVTFLNGKVTAIGTQK